MKRHLAAILAADIVGYSRMMAEDESGTLAALKSCVTEVIEPAVGQHTGRIFKTMGDGFYAVSASPKSATGAALDAQRALAATDFTAMDGLRVRMALNTGTADERDGVYFGPTLNLVGTRSRRNRSGYRLSARPPPPPFMTANTSLRKAGTVASTSA